MFVQIQIRFESGFQKGHYNNLFLKQKNQDINSLCRFFKNLELLYVDKFQN